jgi:transposase InsO family protein
LRQYYPETGLKVVCGLFGKTRQAYYKQQWTEEGLVMRNAIVIKTVRDIRADMPRIGTRKLHYLLTDTLAQHGLDIGRDRLFDLLADYEMLVRRRKRKKIYTTDSNHPFRKYPNMIRDSVITAPNQLWVSDITYITLSGNFCYLSLITDAYSRKIIGYCLYPTLEKEGPLSALQMAINQWGHHSALIHHSDRGLQYCCAAYTSILDSNGIAISMTEKGDPYENAIAERVNGILKHEFEINCRFKSFDEAEQAICKAIQTYNELRPHGSCDYMTPDQAHKTEGLLISKWKVKNGVASV